MVGPRTRQWPILTGGGSSAAASGKQRALPGMPRRGTEHGTVAGAGGLLSVHGKDRVPAEDRVSHVIVLVDTPQRIASGDWWTCPDDGRALRRDTASMRSPVLIVDDHNGFRAVARTLLESEGFDVVGEAADGGSAVVAAVALCPGVILLDVHLPDVDGFSVARQLAGLPEPPAVVLASSRPIADLRRRVRDSPVAMFLGKGELSGAAVSRSWGERRAGRSVEGCPNPRTGKRTRLTVPPSLDPSDRPSSVTVLAASPTFRPRVRQLHHGTPGTRPDPNRKVSANTPRRSPTSRPAAPPIAR